ncbi:hypothetical protein GN956_G2123 [Arapaima gigas]
MATEQYSRAGPGVRKARGRRWDLQEEGRRALEERGGQRAPGRSRNRTQRAERRRGNRGAVSTRACLPPATE